MLLKILIIDSYLYALVIKICTSYLIDYEILLINWEKEKRKAGRPLIMQWDWAFYTKWKTKIQWLPLNANMH